MGLPVVSGINQDKWHNIRYSGAKANNDGKVGNIKGYMRGQFKFLFIPLMMERLQPRGGIVLIPCARLLATPGDGVLSDLTEPPNFFVLTIRPYSKT